MNWGLVRVLYLHELKMLLRARRTVVMAIVLPAVIMPLMLWTGLSHRRRLHLTLAALFGVLWTGTFVTGIFFLPHAPQDEANKVGIRKGSGYSVAAVEGTGRRDK